MGWGAVVNEAMNSGCAVLVSHVVGAAPFLIKQNQNGRVYQYGNMEEFCKSLEDYLDNPSLVSELGRNAYKTMTELWNIEIAVPRFLSIVRSIQSNQQFATAEDGPCSYAQDINTNWYEG